VTDLVASAAFGDRVVGVAPRGVRLISADRPDSELQIRRRT
jgi:hypothetical protein